jgi:protein disulfide-isomerase
MVLQEALQKLGFYCGEEDTEFSSFSTGTERAVKTWQVSEYSTSY